MVSLQTRGNSENFNPSLFFLFTLAVLFQAAVAVPKYDIKTCQPGFASVSDVPQTFLSGRDKQSPDVAGRT